jgi:hypothetical protein
MDFLKYFRKDLKLKNKVVDNPEPSSEQLHFAETVLNLVDPTVEKFGFMRISTNIRTYSTSIIYRKAEQYVKVSSTTYPTDYPYFFNITLGEGDSEDFLEYDWNSITICIIKNSIEKIETNEFDFPYKDDVKPSIENAVADLLKYGGTFLKGDMTLFREVRSQFNELREPYKIYSQDENGNYFTRIEPVSAVKKKKYS